MLLIAGLGTLLTSVQVRSQDADDFVLLFSKYIDADSRLSEQGITPEIRAITIKERDAILEIILSKPQEAGSSFAKQYLNLKARKSIARQRQLLNFAMQTELARDEFIEFARDAILETDLNAPRDPLLTTALEYLGEHGEESDLEIMARLDDHANPTYAQIRDRFAERLRQRLAKGNDTAAAGVKASKQQTDSAQIPETESVVESGEAEESSLPSWALPVIVVAVLGILAILARAFFRGRAS